MDKPARTRRKEERPGEILGAAFEEFVLKGYAATRLDDVAARAGVTKGTIYFYFQSKEQLFATMVRDLLRPMAARAEAFMERCAQDASAPADQLRASLRFFYDDVVSDRRAGEMLRLLIAEAGRFPDLVDEHFRSFVGPLVRRLGETLRRGAEAGTLRSSPVAGFPEILLAPALQLNLWMLAYSDRVPVDPDGHFEATVDVLLNGLLPHS